MNPSLFTALSTYKPNDDVNPEENFSTELLVHLLRHSLKKRTGLFSLFAEKFLQVPVQVEDYGDVSIETQEQFQTKKGVKAIPDITIKTRDGYLFIEVKVEAGLNYYDEADDGGNATKTVNQIEHYQTILVNPKRVYVLTKHPCELPFEGCPDFKGKFRWHRIHHVLKYEYEPGEPSEKYLMGEIIGYLEDKGMSIEKVTFELERGMKMVNNLFEQLEKALEGRQYKYSSGADWMGYYIGGKNGKGADEKAAWVGNYYDGNRLVFEHYDAKVRDHIKKNAVPGYEVSDNGRHTDSFFVFEEKQYFCLGADEQVDAITEWVNDNYRLIEEHGG